MEIKQYENGLRLVVNTSKNKDIVSFKVFVKAGSMDEDENNLGTAHFLEHMFFKSTKKHTAKELLTRFDFFGANQNAYTSNTKTCYYFQSLSENLKNCIELYSEMFFNRDYNKEEIENEKNVIIEELKRDEDIPSSKCIRLAVNSLFNETPYQHDIIGTEESVRKISKQKLVDFKNKYYNAKNIVISVSGNVTMAKISKLVERYFVKKFKNENLYVREDKFYSLNAKEKYIAFNKDNQQSCVYIITDLGNLSTHKRRAYLLYYAILGLDMSSKLFQRIREEKGFVYDISANSTVLLKNSFGEIIFQTSSDNVDEALKEIKCVINECANGDITEEELTKIKNKISSELTYDTETNSAIASANGSSLTDKNYIEKDEDIINDIKSITLDEILECAKEVASNNNFVVSSVGTCTKDQLEIFN